MLLPHPLSSFQRVHSTVFNISKNVLQMKGRESSVKREEWRWSAGPSPPPHAAYTVCSPGSSYKTWHCQGETGCP